MWLLTQAINTWTAKIISLWVISQGVCTAINYEIKELQNSPFALRNMNKLWKYVKTTCLGP